MSLWTPYLDEPMDLTKRKPPCARVMPSENWHTYFEAASPREDRATSSPGSSEPEPEQDPEYLQFERDALSALALPQHNPRMRRHIQCQGSDEQYLRQRQRNNAAAKKSRDRRKIRELRLGIQVAFLIQRLQKLQGRLAEECYEQPYTMYK